MSIYKGDNLIAGSGLDIDLTPDPIPTEGSPRHVMSGGVYGALLTKEDAANKTTVVDASSTDDQYPSAKAVYDALKNLVRRPAWEQSILLSVEVLTGGYKAPADGMIVGILYTHGTTSTGVSLSVNGVEVARNKAKDADHILNVQCPVGKDDVITISDEESQMNSAIRFVPYKAQ